MSKNQKKKNAIRFGVIAVAILLFAGTLSVWALSTQATATAGVGTVQPDGITVSQGSGSGSQLLENSIAGKPGTVNTPFELYTIDDSEAVATDYTAIVYLTNGADLMDEGLRYMTLDIELQDDEGATVDSHTLTLENGRVAFNFTAGDIDSGSVTITGGTYGSYYPWADISSDVSFLIDVEGV